MGFRHALLAVFMTASVTNLFGTAFFSSVTVDDGIQAPAAAQSSFSFADVPVSVNFSSSQFGTDSFVGSASAESDIGTLRAAASATLTSYQGVNFYDSGLSINPATATAGFGDTLTMGNGVGTGYMVLVYELTGSATSSGDLAVPATAGAQGILTVRTGSELPFSGSIVNSTGFTNGFTYSSPGIQFTFGAPIAFSTSLNAFFFVQDELFAPGFTYSQTGSADFGSTAVLTHLLFYSDPGLTNQLAGVGVTANSGFSYTVGEPAGVPEPGTIVLMSAGLAWIAFSKRRVPASRS